MSTAESNMVSFFFFQAEDGIRDTSVTGVQTCALPIFDFLNHAVDDSAFGGTARAGQVAQHRLICGDQRGAARRELEVEEVRLQSDRKSTRLNSSHRCISYAVFCLKKKKNESALVPIL